MSYSYSYPTAYTYNGTSGNDLFGGTWMNDVVYGGAGNDRLGGGSMGNDTIDGGLGDDIIAGGIGFDVLTGGEGKDLFAISNWDGYSLSAFTLDRITDFNAADDKIMLDTAFFKTIGFGALKAEAFCIGASAADANDRVGYDPTTGKVWYDADGKGGVAQEDAFAQITPGLALTHMNFAGYSGAILLG